MQNSSKIAKKPPSLYTAWVSGFFFPLHEALKKHDSMALRKQMKNSQWWNKQQLREFQLEKLRELLIHAQARVPYYRQLFSETGFEADNIQSLSQLERLPLLNKPIIRANTEALKSDQAQHLSRYNTGGSSGEPAGVFYR